MPLFPGPSAHLNYFGPDAVSGILTARSRNERVGIGPKVGTTG